jgi:hypothetical protein
MKEPHIKGDGIRPFQESASNHIDQVENNYATRGGFTSDTKFVQD